MHLAKDHNSLRILLQVRLIVYGAMFRHIVISLFVQPLLILNIETGLLLRLELILRSLISARIVNKIYGATIDFILRKGANSYAGRDIA